MENNLELFSVNKVSLVQVSSCILTLDKYRYKGMALTWPPKKRAKIKLLILTGLERFIVFIANIKDSDVTVNGFLFEIKNGQKLPLKKGCPDELLGESPLRLNKAVMEIVRIGAESLNEKDQVPRPIEGNSGQNETESTEIAEADEGTPGENEMCGTPSIDDRDKTFSASMSASESKEIVDNSGKKNSNAINNDNSSNDNSSNDNSSHRKDNENKNNIDDNNDDNDNTNNNKENGIKIIGGNSDNKNNSRNNNSYNNNNNNNSNSNNNSASNSNNNDTNESKTEQEQENTGIASTILGWLKGNSSKNKLQTPSKEKHPNEPRQQVTTEQQPNRASVTPSDAEADEGIPGENEMCGTPSIDDKDKTVSASMSAFESKEIVDNSGRENSNNAINDDNSNNNGNSNNGNSNNGNINDNGHSNDNNNSNNNSNNNNSDINSHQNDNNNNNSKSKTGQEQEKTSTRTTSHGTSARRSSAKNESKTRQEEKTGPRTKLEGTPVEGGGTAFKLLGSSSSLSSTRYLKSTCNSSKNKLQTPSNEEHSIEQQQTEQV